MDILSLASIIYISSHMGKNNISSHTCSEGDVGVLTVVEKVDFVLKIELKRLHRLADIRVDNV